MFHAQMEAINLLANFRNGPVKIKYNISPVTEQTKRGTFWQLYEFIKTNYFLYYGILIMKT